MSHRYPIPATLRTASSPVRRLQARAPQPPYGVAAGLRRRGSSRGRAATARRACRSRASRTVPAEAPEVGTRASSRSRTGCGRPCGCCSHGRHATRFSHVLPPPRERGRRGRRCSRAGCSTRAVVVTAQDAAPGQGHPAVTRGSDVAGEEDDRRLVEAHVPRSHRRVLRRQHCGLAREHEHDRSRERHDRQRFVSGVEHESLHIPPPLLLGDGNPRSVSDPPAVACAGRAPRPGNAKGVVHQHNALESDTDTDMYSAPEPGAVVRNIRLCPIGFPIAYGTQSSQG